MSSVEIRMRDGIVTDERKAMTTVLATFTPLGYVALFIFVIVIVVVRVSINRRNARR
jgi:hypothetical protein